MPTDVYLYSDRQREDECATDAKKERCLARKNAVDHYGEQKATDLAADEGQCDAQILPVREREGVRAQQSVHTEPLNE